MPELGLIEEWRQQAGKFKEARDYTISQGYDAPQLITAEACMGIVSDQLDEVTETLPHNYWENEGESWFLCVLPDPRHNPGTCHRCRIRGAVK